VTAGRPWAAASVFRASATSSTVIRRAAGASVVPTLIPIVSSASLVPGIQTVPLNLMPSGKSTTATDGPLSVSVSVSASVPVPVAAWLS
jgi:hypothetical protein